MERQVLLERLSAIFKWINEHHHTITDEQRKLGLSNLDRMYQLHLNSYNAWWLLHCRFFNRIGRWIGHGFCYEASVLEMLAWRGYPNSRLVFGKIYFPDTDDMGGHAWIEFWHNMHWWVIDPTSYTLVVPMEWSVYRKEQAARRRRVISYHEFWENPISQNLYELLQAPETSYLFGELMLYRPEHDGETQMLMEKYGRRDLMTDGTRFSVFSTFALSRYERPVNQEIINQFAINENRKHPKRHTCRQAAFEVAAIKSYNSPSK